MWRRWFDVHQFELVTLLNEWPGESTTMLIERCWWIYLAGTQNDFRVAWWTNILRRNFVWFDWPKSLVPFLFLQLCPSNFVNKLWPKLQRVVVGRSTRFHPVRLRPSLVCVCRRLFSPQLVRTVEDFDALPSILKTYFWHRVWTSMPWWVYCQSKGFCHDHFDLTVTQDPRIKIFLADPPGLTRSP